MVWPSDFYPLAHTFICGHMVSTLPTKAHSLWWCLIAQKCVFMWFLLRACLACSKEMCLCSKISLTEPDVIWDGRKWTKENALLFQGAQGMSCAKSFPLFMMKFCLAQRGRCCMSSVLLAASFQQQQRRWNWNQKVLISERNKFVQRQKAFLSRVTDILLPLIWFESYLGCCSHMVGWQSG